MTSDIFSQPTNQYKIYSHLVKHLWKRLEDDYKRSHIDSPVGFPYWSQRFNSLILPAASFMVASSLSGEDKYTRSDLDELMWFFHPIDPDMKDANEGYEEYESMFPLQPFDPDDATRLLLYLKDTYSEKEPAYTGARKKVMRSDDTTLIGAKTSLMRIVHGVRREEEGAAHLPPNLLLILYGGGN